MSIGAKFNLGKFKLQEIRTELLSAHQHVWALPSLRFAFDACQAPEALDALMTSSPAIAGVILTMGHTNLERYLSKVPFIKRSKLSADQLRMLGELGSYLARDKGTTLFSQGDSGDAFYVLLQGQVEVWVDWSTTMATMQAHNEDLRTSAAFDAIQRASVLGPGDHIGESALVVEGDRSATIKVHSRPAIFRLGNCGLLPVLHRVTNCYRLISWPFDAMTPLPIAGSGAVNFFRPGEAQLRRFPAGCALARGGHPVAH